MKIHISYFDIEILQKIFSLQLIQIDFFLNVNEMGKKNWGKPNLLIKFLGCFVRFFILYKLKPGSHSLSLISFKCVVFLYIYNKYIMPDAVISIMMYRSFHISSSMGLSKYCTLLSASPLNGEWNTNCYKTTSRILLIITRSSMFWQVNKKNVFCLFWINCESCFLKL